MKRLFSIIPVAIALMVVSCNKSERRIDTFSPASFENPEMTYRSMPFWSLNDSLSTDEIRRQLRLFKEGGFGGAFLHSRLGLLTPYLSEEWFKMMEAGVDECGKLGMEAWFYDEDKWPSGFAGGIIPRRDESFRAHTLVRLPSGTNLSDEDRLLFNDGEHLYVDFRDRMGQPWYNGTCWVDLMNPEMVKAFIDCSYRPYAERFGAEKAAKGIFSDEPQVSPRTVDYPDADMTFPYSPMMEEAFKARWGYDMDPILPCLADTVGEWRQARLHYYRTVASCMETAFSGQIGDWCNENGLIWTGHYNGEQEARANMKNEGDLMQQLAHMGAPGVDALGLKHLNYHNDKVMTSVANQYGKKRRLIEIFGISGHNLSFEDRMWITSWHTACGANFMCPHLSLYSMKGERKRDFPPTLNYQQPYWSANKLFDDWSARLCYAASCGKSEGQVCMIGTIETDYLVSGPSKIDYGSDTYEMTENIISQAVKSHLNIDIADEETIGRIGSTDSCRFIVGEMSYTTVVVPHLLTIRPKTLELVKDFARKGGKVIVVKACPSFIDGVHDKASLKELAVLADLVADDTTSLRMAFDGLSHPFVVRGEGCDEIMTSLRTCDNGITIQASNCSRTSGRMVEFEMNDLEDSDRIYLLDPIDGKCMGITPQNDNNRFNIFFNPAQTWLIFKGKSLTRGNVPAYSIPVAKTSLMSLSMPMEGRRTDPNCLPLDFAEMSVDSAKTWNEKEPVLAIYKRSEKAPVDGPLLLRYSFNISSLPENISLGVEQPWMYESISVNDREACRWSEDGYIDATVRKTDISEYIHTGRNEIVLALDYKSPRTTSANAIERYGSEIETIYLIGDFGVNTVLSGDQPQNTWRNTSRKLAPKPMPSRFVRDSLTLGKEIDSFDGDLTPNGYPFYAGCFEYRSAFELSTVDSDKKYFIRFPEVEATLVKVTINGKEFPTIFCNPWESDISGAVKEGVNEVTITLTGSLRNLMGPYHNAGGEFYSVGPATFTGGADWPNIVAGDKDWYDKRKEGNAILWRDDYYSIPFGLLSAPEIMIED